MRKLILLILVLCLAASGCALADEIRKVQTSLFSIDLPADLTYDADEFSLEKYSYLKHILKPITIQGWHDDYTLMISLYDFPSDERHRIDNRPDKQEALFDLIREYNALERLQGVRTVRPEGDFRDFVIGSDPARDYHIATYFNENRGEGYVFELQGKNAAMTTAEAEALLLSIVTTLREASEIYPEYTGKTLVITQVGINVRSAPNPNSSVLLVAQQGQTFPFLGENGIWYMVDVNGKIGYVSKSLSAIQE